LELGEESCHKVETLSSRVVTKLMKIELEEERIPREAKHVVLVKVFYDYCARPRSRFSSSQQSESVQDRIAKVQLINEAGNVMEGKDGETSQYVKVKFVCQWICNHGGRGGRLFSQNLKKLGKISQKTILSTNN
jgi:hypothetical protein